MPCGHICVNHITRAIYCERHRGVTNEFLNTYDDLEAHFRSLHFLCEDDGCLAQKFVVFNSEVELQAHCGQVHMTNAPRRTRQVALPVQWTLTRRPEQDARAHASTLPPEWVAGAGAGGAACSWGARPVTACSARWLGGRPGGRRPGAWGGGGQQLQEAGQGPSTRRWRISRGCRRLPRESAGEDEGAQRQEGGVRQGLSMADRVQGLSMADRVLGSATHPRGRWNPTAEGASGSMRRPGRWRLCAATGRRAWAGSWPRRRYETRQELGRRLRSSTRRWSGRLRRSRTSLTKVARGAESERLGQHAGGGRGEGPGSAMDRGRNMAPGAAPPAEVAESGAARACRNKEWSEKSGAEVMAAVKALVKGRYDEFRTNSAQFARGELEGVDYYTEFAEEFAMLEAEGLFAPMVALLPAAETSRGAHGAPSRALTATHFGERSRAAPYPARAPRPRRIASPGGGAEQCRAGHGCRAGQRDG